MSRGKTDKDLEWEKRTLCSDGNCIGVIGADGRCKECGKVYDGDLPVLEAGLTEKDGDVVYNTAVLVGLIYTMLPFMILNIYVSLEGIDKSLTEAARSLGCTEWQAFREVILPLSLPGVSAGCLLVFVLSAGTYITPLILGGPGNEMIANLIYNRVIGTLDWPFGSAISVLLIGLLGIIVFTYNKYLGINQIFKNLGGRTD